VVSPNSPEKDTSPAEIDITRPHPARTWDYYLGGKDNFAADREVADKVIAAWPGMRVSARENRKFIGRAIQYLAGEAGIDQFLDIGSGLPTASNVHEVAQAINPAARVVYVDNDPLVLVHARALLTSSPEGKCAYIQADLREPEKILSAPATQETLDFTRPIALILSAIVHFLLPEDQPARIIKTLVDALPSGSYVAASHGSTEYGTQEEADVVVRLITASGVRIAPRDSADFGNLVFDGLSLVAPGVVLLPEWRPNPDGAPRPGAREVGSNAGVARKP
jgi:O-methyltransferase involved in polyketide biosynthesis